MVILQGYGILVGDRPYLIVITIWMPRKLYKGIVKQQSANYGVICSEEKKKNKNRYSLNEILKFKTGLIEDDLMMIH